ncbi:hypothetical protein JB92DRAFT_2886620 [Gautieria morchelliformis]|nr:hypothetical protein JB92DRAFT_2886620 [Gautieria morchelliformis]
MHTPEGGNVSSQKIGQMAADEVQDYDSSTRGRREIVQTVTETAQVDDLSSLEITKQTATESAQENGSSLRDIPQANPSLSQDNLEVTTELALQAMPPQTSTMVDSSNANVCVSVAEQAGHEQSFDTVSSGQNVSYSTTEEAVALGNKNVEPAFGADETTGFTVKTDAIMDTTASTDDRNLDANVAVVEEKLDNSEHEEGAQTINTVTNPATGMDLVEVSQPVTSPMMEQGCKYLFTMSHTFFAEHNLQSRLAGHRGTPLKCVLILRRMSVMRT